MKAIVLSGGYATRLWPITKRRPKMFLPIGETTVIDRILSDLEDEDRISEVYVSTNERFADEFRTHLEESGFEKPTLSVEETTTEDEKLGVVGALAQLVDREDIDEETVVIAGDNLVGFDVGEFVDFFERESGPVLAAYDVASREEAKSYGLVTIDGKTVVDFREKPTDPNSTLVSIACYGFTPETLDALSVYLESGRNPDEPGWFVKWLQERTTVTAFTFDGVWFDVGTVEGYLDALAWGLDGDAIVSESATVENATLGSGVYVMEGAKVVDSSVDRAVVFPNATIRNCDVRSSIVDAGAELDGLQFTVTDALIGAHSRVRSGSRRPVRDATAVPVADGGDSRER